MPTIKLAQETQFNDSQVAKLKIVFPLCHCHEIYRVKEGVRLKNSNYTLKKHIFCEYLKFRAISWKIDFSSIAAKLKLKSEITFAHM